MTAPERRGPERPGPDYPPEWDLEPDEQRDPDGACNVCGSYEPMHRHGDVPDLDEQ